jgi:hypothetical protein
VRLNIQKFKEKKQFQKIEKKIKISKIKKLLAPTVFSTIYADDICYADGNLACSDADIHRRAVGVARPSCSVYASILLEIVERCRHFEISMVI